MKAYLSHIALYTALFGASFQLMGIVYYADLSEDGYSSLESEWAKMLYNKRIELEFVCLSENVF